MLIGHGSREGKSPTETSVSAILKCVPMYPEALSGALPWDNVGCNVKNMSVQEVCCGNVANDRKNGPAKEGADIIAQVIILRPEFVSTGSGPLLKCRRAHWACPLAELKEKTDRPSGKELERALSSWDLLRRPSTAGSWQPSGVEPSEDASPGWLFVLAVSSKQQVDKRAAAVGKVSRASQKAQRTQGVISPAPNQPPSAVLSSLKAICLLDSKDGVTIITHYKASKRMSHRSFVGFFFFF